MISNSKQQWTVGQTVKVGFVTGLEVVAVVPTPGDSAPDAYILSRKEQLYSFVPHIGLSKIDIAEARAMVERSKQCAEQQANAALARAAASARHADLVNELVSA